MTQHATHTRRVRTVHLPDVCGVPVNGDALNPTPMWRPFLMASAWNGRHRKLNVQVTAFDTIFMFP